MVRAAQSLQQIAKGNGTDVDLAEIALAVNGSKTDWCGVVWLDEVREAVENLRESSEMDRNSPSWDLDEVERISAQVDDLTSRMDAILRA